MNELSRSIILLTLLTVVSFGLSLGVFYFIKSAIYKKTAYYQMTRNSFWKLLHSKGLFGEYLIYKRLRRYEKDARFLFNTYLPKEDGDTTEIDVLMIYRDGIYVFESKNYSGWIFGTETQRRWTQSLPQGKRSIKNQFLNPILQNALHLKYLKTYLHAYPDIVYHSLIVFSDRCELKKIQMTKGRAVVIKRSQIVQFIGNSTTQDYWHLSKSQIEAIYQLLYPYSQNPAALKQKHISAIQAKQSARSIQTDIEKLAVNPIGETNPHPYVNAEIAAGTQMIKSDEFTIKDQEKRTCPKCGSTMVLRTAKKGVHAGETFWGCSDFPHCRYKESNN